MYLNYIYLYISKAGPDERMKQTAADFEPIKVFKKFYGEQKNEHQKSKRSYFTLYLGILSLETVLISRKKNIYKPDWFVSITD